MNRILVIGGFGALGRETAAALRPLLPAAEVVATGRNPSRARCVAGTTAIRLDATDDNNLAGALEDVDAVVMCAELGNVRVARACLHRGIPYLDVSATPQQLSRVVSIFAHEPSPRR